MATLVIDMSAEERERWMDERARRERESAERQGEKAAENAEVYRKAEREKAADPEAPSVGPGSASMWRGNAEQAEREVEKHRRQWRLANAELNLTARQRAYRRTILDGRDVKPGGVLVIEAREDGSVRFGKAYARGTFNRSKLYRTGGWIKP